MDAQESEISHELADAVQQLAANEAATRSNLNRRAAAQERVRQFEIEVFNAGTKTLDDLLRAQVSRGDAEVAYYTSLVAYNQSLSNLHYRTGRLLSINNVQLAESEWTPEAYRDALRRAWQRSHGLETDGLLEARPLPFAEPGPVDDQPMSSVESTEALTEGQPAGGADGLSDESEVVPGRPIVPAAFHGLVDRLRQETQNLRERRSVDGEAAFAEPRLKNSRATATYRELVEKMRSAKPSVRDRESRKPDASESPSRTKRLIESIWKSKQAEVSELR